MTRELEETYIDLVWNFIGWSQVYGWPQVYGTVGVRWCGLVGYCGVTRSKNFSTFGVGGKKLPSN